VIHAEVVVIDPLGIHALVAQRLTLLAKRFASSVYLRHEGHTASLDNPVALLALGVRLGTCVSVWADGADEVAATAAVVHILNSNDSDDQLDETPLPQTQ
jgi:phosphocarrier protein HPr